MRSDVVVLGPEQYDDWNRFVDLSPQGDVFCYSWWLDAVTKSRFRIFVVKEKNEIVAGMPLAFDKYGRINEPFLTRTLGILYKVQDNLSENRRISNQRKWAHELLVNISIDNFVQTCTHHSFKDWLPFRWKGFKQTTRYTYLLFYKGRTAEELKSNLDDSCRNVINKAEKKGLIVECSEDLHELYTLVSMTYERQGTRFRITFPDLKSLDDAIMMSGNRLILRVTDSEKNVHAGIYVAYNQRSAYFLLSGSNPQYRKEGGHTLVFWGAIRHFRDKVDHCNFGGSDIRRIESHLKGFGGQLTPYFHIYNERQVYLFDIKHHCKRIFYHSFDILRALRLNYFKN